MKTSRERIRMKTVLGCTGLLMGGFFLAGSILGGCKKLSREKEQAHSGQAPSSETAGAAEDVVILDRAAQLKGGIVVEALPTVSHRKELRAYGRILGLGDLVDIHNQCTAARAQKDRTKAVLEASRKEYRRLEVLCRDNRNISEKLLEQAEASWRVAAAQARAAEESLKGLEQAARQQWGAMLASCLPNGTPTYQRLVQQQDVLVQVTLPPGGQIPQDPGAATVQAADGSRVIATFVSPSPRTDPRIQGASLFYTAPAKPAALAAGMNVSVYLPVGPSVKGCLVPLSSLVWWQGKAWAYFQKGPDRFVRREVPAEVPLQNGWFVEKGVACGGRVVVQGAQLLFSEKFRAQLKAGDEETEE